MSLQVLRGSAASEIFAAVFFEAKAGLDWWA